MSSASAVISVEGLSKRYQIGHQLAGHESFREMLGRKARGLIGGGKAGSAEVEDFWALKDVSFDVREGEVMGVIGRNGAGKSTLLKILSRITAPTEGRVALRGQVASLLEVGTGFHPELTGRENIFLNGAILGMSRRDIALRFDEIVDFAEVERFLDTPVKRYSSGMYVRLAFSVAAHLDSDILIVDEVLAVGDVEFQKKCLGKMRGVTGNGRAAIFVSHNISAVRSLCDSAILLDGGQIVSSGTVERPIHDYFTLFRQPIAHKATDGIPGIQSVQVMDASQSSAHVLNDAENYRVKFSLLPRSNAKSCQIAFTIFNNEDVGLISAFSPQFALAGDGLQDYFVELPTQMLNSGNYRIEGAVFDSYGLIEQIDCLAIFELLRTSQFDQKHNDSRGLVRFDAIWSGQGL